MLRKLKLKKRASKAHSAILKTPIVRWRNDVYLRGSHKANVPPSSRVILSLAHFKFTHDFHRKTAQAMDWKTHAGGGGKYFYYNELERQMKDFWEAFLCSESVAYTGPKQLEEIGLLNWELPLS